MPGDVEQHLLVHQVEMAPTVHTEPFGERVRRAVEDMLDVLEQGSRLVLHLRDQVFEPVVAGVDHPDDVPQILDHVPGQVRDLGELLALGRFERGLIGDHLAHQGNRAELAADVVVQVAGDVHAQPLNPQQMGYPQAVHERKQADGESRCQHPEPPRLPERRHHRDPDRRPVHVPDAVVV